MNKKSTVLILATAVVLGLVTAFAVFRYVKTLEQNSKQSRQDVVVAATAIKPRIALQPHMLTVKSMLVDAVAKDAATSINQVVGKMSLDAYKPDEQIRIPDLITKDKLPGVSYAIPEGKRAVTIRVDDIKGVGGALHPGDQVDILATYRDPVSGQQLTSIILQRMDILAIDDAQMDTAKGGKGASKSVTLAATPEEAAKLTVTEGEGALRMMLRPENEKTVVEMAGVTLRGLVKPQMVETDSVPLQATSNLPIGEKEPPKVRIIKGSEPAREITVGE